MKLKDLIPSDGTAPRTGLPESCETYWCSPDDEQAYERNRGHPVYGERDIVYRYNRFGYRAPEFDDTGGIKMLSVGCSWTFGLGVPHDVTFHERFAQALRERIGEPVLSWNLGVLGASNDSIVRLLQLAVPMLKPQLVLVLFTDASRREYVAAHDRRMNFAPDWAKATDPVAREIAGHLSALRSDYDDGLNLFRNYKSAEALLSGRTRWYYSFARSGDEQRIAGHLDEERRAPAHRWIDSGRDHEHPGPETHESLFESFWSAFERSGGVGPPESGTARSA